MLHAFKLYTGPDNASHVKEGTVAENDRTDVVAIHFKETPAHSSFDWHNDPEPQYVITLSGRSSSPRAMARPSWCVRATCWSPPTTWEADTSGG
jgi:hypothetical protein